MPKFLELTEESQFIVDDSHCVYCHTDLLVKEEVAICHECGSPHHAECWHANNNRCATFGCTGRGDSHPSRAREVVPPPVNRPATAPSPRTHERVQRPSTGQLMNGRRALGIVAFMGMILYTLLFEAGQIPRAFVQSPVQIATPAPVNTRPQATATTTVAALIAAPTTTPIAAASSPIESAAFSTCADSVGIDPGDCEVLVEFYNSTNGPDWTFNIGWLETDTPCEWYGVDCEVERVTRIQLSNNRLIGTLPKEIGNLGQLKSLSLTSNGLSGEIPSTIGQLTELRFLRLAKNRLSGSIPSELGQNDKLVALNLQENRLSGAIPAELNQLETLTMLNASYNDLGGEIPADVVCLNSLQRDTSQIELDYNRLHSVDQEAIQCLNNRNHTWDNTQTVAPTDFSGTLVSTTKIDFTWTPILYSGSGFDGRYEIGRSDDEGETYVVIAQTITKKHSSLAVSVTAETTGESLYAIRSVTEPQVAQQNNLISEYSEPIRISSE